MLNSPAMLKEGETLYAKNASPLSQRAQFGMLLSICHHNALYLYVSHLPVKTLLFVCPICTHGGHQGCYRQYHAGRLMAKLAIASSSQKASQNSKDVIASNSSNLDTPDIPASIARHPCAAGCGHYCWAANALMSIL